MLNSILYYPSINIWDSAWLRNAILYWDEVCSIVPGDNGIDFSPEIKYLKENNLYRSVPASDLFLSTEYEKFCNEIVNRLKGGQNKNLSGNYNRYSVNVPNLIHCKKIPSKLFGFMEKEGYLKMNQSEDWIEMDVQISDIYMATLAKYLAKIDDQNMVIGTDKNKHLDMTYPYSRSVGDNLCFTAIFEKAMPMPNLDVPYEEIVNFKDRRSQELLQFRQEIRNFEEKLSKCTTIVEIKRIILEFQTQWEISLSEMEKLLKEHNIGFHLGSMKALIDSGSALAIMQFIKQEYGSVPTWLIGVCCGMAGVVGVGTNFIKNRNTLREDMKHNGFAYLYQAYKDGIIRRSSFTEML